MTAPADSRISDERLDEMLASAEADDRADHWAAYYGGDLVSALTELRERRAQAVTPVAWRVEWPKEGLLEHFSNEKTARGMEAGGATVTPLYAPPFRLRR